MISQEQARLGSERLIGLPTARRPDIDGLKAFAIMGVVLIHIHSPGRLSSDCMLWVNWLKVLFGWCVMAFFFCSGLLTQQLPKNNLELGVWIGKRTKRLLLPCLVFSIAYKTALFLVTRTGWYDWKCLAPSTVEDWLSFFLIPVGPQFYFLPYLFAISSICIAAATVIKRLWLVWMVVTAAHLTSGFGFNPPVQANGPAYMLLFSYAHCYMVGLAAEKIGVPVPRWLALNGALGVLAAILLRTSFFLYPVVPLALWWLLQRFQELTSAIGRTQLGQRSGAVFVWHAPLLLPFCSIIAARLLVGRLDGIQVLLTVVTTIAFCYGCDQVTRRFRCFNLFRF